MAKYGSRLHDHKFEIFDEKFYEVFILRVEGEALIKPN